jgi:hypothetical protein
MRDVSRFELFFAAMGIAVILLLLGLAALAATALVAEMVS